MAEQQHIQRAETAEPAAIELDPGEFGLALVMAATWYFAGPWGLVPTAVFLYKIVGARAPRLSALPAPLREFGDGAAWFARLPMAGKAAFLLSRPDAPEYAPALPAPAYDVVGDDNGDGAAEGRTQRLVPTVARVRPVATAERPRWLQALNDDADRAPHALILGPSGAGKTTLATAVMDDRGGRVVVLSPKVSAGAWSGAEVVTLDDDGSYAPLEAALADLEEEKRQRIVTLRTHGRDALEPLTIVLDELQDFTGQVPAAGEFMVNLSSIGREIKMRLIGVGTTDEALNVRGWKASRRNYLRVEMNRDRRAVLSDGVREVSVAPTDSQQRASRARLRPWRGEVEPPTPAPQAAPAADTTQLVRREATIDMADLARLAPSLAAKRGYTPTPQETAALAGLLGLDDAPPAQSVTVERGGGGGPVNVYVQQTATGRSSAMRRGGVSVKDRRRRLGYIEAAKRGEKFEATYRRLGGSRNEMHALFTEHKPK